MFLDPEVYEKAANDTAAFMTAELRQRALRGGWKPEVVDHMHVRFDDNGFGVDIDEEYQEDAWVHEYGSERTRPTAVLRKYSNDSSKAKDIFVNNVSYHGNEQK
jgi:hypothetical protein